VVRTGIGTPPGLRTGFLQPERLGFC